MNLDRNAPGIPLGLLQNTHSPCTQTHSQQPLKHTPTHPHTEAEVVTFTSYLPAHCCIDIYVHPLNEEMHKEKGHRLCKESQQEAAGWWTVTQRHKHMHSHIPTHPSNDIQYNGTMDATGSLGGKLLQVPHLVPGKRSIVSGLDCCCCCCT